MRVDCGFKGHERNASIFIGFPLQMARNAVVRKGTWVRIPPTPPKALRTWCFQGFFFCSGSIYFWENNSNGALGAPLCGARLIPYHTHYTRKMYTVVPQWCPELLKSYEKQRGAIKRYCRYSSISLLFFFAFFDVSCPASFPVTVVFGCSAL